MSMLCAPVETRRTASAIDERTTRHRGYAVSQHLRMRIEEIFGWLKTIGLLRITRHRGTARVEWMFIFSLAAYKLGPHTKSRRPGHMTTRRVRRRPIGISPSSSAWAIDRRETDPMRSSSR
jgi:hypothetical protein